MSERTSLSIQFDRGTLLVQSSDRNLLQDIPWLEWDKRSKAFRCHAHKYRHLVRFLKNNKTFHTDNAPEYSELIIDNELKFSPHDYQEAALDKWSISKRGVVILPTGAGKSFLATLAIKQLLRSTLVIVPTIELMLQWQANLEKQLKSEIGNIGGGDFNLKHITVTTYDSARIHAERLGNRFCFIIFDECHHLPSPGYSEMARAYIAPYRIGLSATIDLEQSKLFLLKDLVGPIVFEKKITELTGEFLASYDVETIFVELSEEEKEEYQYHREIYLEFKDRYFYGRRFNWQSFVFTASQSNEGRKALKSFQIQKSISIAAKEKFNELSKIILKHQGERILIFTNDNKTALKISTHFFVPMITHQIKAKERKLVLENFKSGKWPVLASSRVLNEGVDVPEASIAIIISGTSVVREHVQRLGRILRKKGDKKAILYELITKETGEVYTHKKRREHQAYQN